MNPVRRRLLPGLLAIAAVLAVGTAALAYWTARGDGTAAGSSGSTSVLTISPGVPAAALYPGGRSAVQLTVTNPGGSAVRVSALALDSTQGADGFAAGAAHPDCDESVLGFTTQTNGGAGWSVPANGSLSITLANALSMVADADNDCQGATFTVYLGVAG